MTPPERSTASALSPPTRGERVSKTPGQGLEPQSPGPEPGVTANWTIPDSACCGKEYSDSPGPETRRPVAYASARLPLGAKNAVIASSKPGIEH